MEKTKDLKEKMEKLADSFSEDKDKNVFDGFYERIRKLSKKIKKKYLLPARYATAYSVLIGSSISTEGTRVVDFPEPELSVRRFIEEEYNKRFPEENKQE